MNLNQGYKTLAITLLIFVALLCSSACSSKLSKQAELESSYATLYQLEERFGTIKDTQVHNFLNRVVTRLGNAVYEAALERDLNRKQARKFANYPWQIVVLDKANAEAYSTGAGIIFISRGLFYQLGSEAELASIISHEMSHYILGHVHQAIANQGLSAGVPQVSFSLDQELDADNLGVKILRVARYDARHALGALSLAYRQSDQNVSSDELDSFEKRSEHLRSKIVDLGHFLPATQNTREFMKVRQILSHS